MRRSLLQLLNIPCYLDTDARILIRILVTRQGMQSGGVAMCFSVRIDRAALGDVMPTDRSRPRVRPTLLNLPSAPSQQKIQLRLDI